VYSFPERMRPHGGHEQCEEKSGEGDNREENGPRVAELQSQVAALQASLGGVESAPQRRGRRPGKAAAAAGNSDAVAPARRRRRSRKLGKRITDADALAKLTKVVSSAGSDGVSAVQASQSSGVSYPRAIGLMDKHFKKRGSGRWTRYTLK
jgi:hypothetical protein